MLLPRSLMQQEPKEGKSTLQEKWELAGAAQGQQEPGPVLCSTTESLLYVCVRYMVGQSTVASNQSLVKKSCDLLPTARCQDLQGPRPLLCIRLKSGTAGCVLPAPPFPADRERLTRQQRTLSLSTWCHQNKGKQGKA